MNANNIWSAAGVLTTNAGLSRMATFSLSSLTPRIQSLIMPVPMCGCWLWTGHTWLGYGYYNRVRAHRLIYTSMVGPIPDGLQVDHLCRVRSCVNPAHLEPVTCRENLRRSPIAVVSPLMAATHCKKGHPLVVGPSHWKHGRKRRCPICRAERNIAYHQERRAKIRQRRL